MYLSLSFTGNISKTLKYIHGEMMFSIFFIVQKREHWLKVYMKQGWLWSWVMGTQDYSTLFYFCSNFSITQFLKCVFTWSFLRKKETTNNVDVCYILQSFQSLYQYINSVQMSMRKTKLFRMIYPGKQKMNSFIMHICLCLSKCFQYSLKNINALRILFPNRYYQLYFIVFNLKYK